jgi:hypothetical protein
MTTQKFTRCQVVTRLDMDEETLLRGWFRIEFSKDGEPSKRVQGLDNAIGQAKFDMLRYKHLGASITLEAEHEHRICNLTRSPMPMRDKVVKINRDPIMLVQCQPGDHFTYEGIQGLRIMGLHTSPDDRVMLAVNLTNGKPLDIPSDTIVERYQLASWV